MKPKILGYWNAGSGWWQSFDNQNLYWVSTRGMRIKVIKVDPKIINVWLGETLLESYFTGNWTDELSDILDFSLAIEYPDEVSYYVAIRKNFLHLKETRRYYTSQLHRLGVLDVLYDGSYVVS